MSLRSLFDGSVPLSRDLFTNRVSESAAFNDAIGLMKSETRRPDLLDDLVAPARHVLTFHGLGGTGKSALADHLRVSLVEGRRHPGAYIVSFDMSRTSARNAESVLIDMRAAIAARGIPAPAFDLAFSRYWAISHPGRPMQEFLARTTLSDAVGRSIDLGAVIQDSVEDLVETVLEPGAFGAVGLTMRVAKKLVSAVHTRSERVAVLEHSPHLAEAIASSDEADILGFLPRFLAWDLHRYTLSEADTVPEEQASLLVVIMDEWECVQATSDARGDIEDVLSALIALMPNVLFVIAGRERLAWADESASGTLRISGPHRWPGLNAGVTEGIRQHRVGPLSEKDARSFLERAIPDAAPNIISAIVGASGGHPDYLDCAVVLVAARREGGESVTESDFSGGFPQLLTRLLKGLSVDERDYLLTASHLPTFSPELLLHLIPRADRSSVERFLRRHFVEASDRGWLRFRIARTARGIVVANSEHVYWSSEAADSVRAKAVLWICAESVRKGAVSSRADRERLTDALVAVCEMVGDATEVPSEALSLILLANAAGVNLTAANLDRTVFTQVASLFLGLERDLVDVPSLISRLSESPAGWLTDLGWIAVAREALLRDDLELADAYRARVSDSVTEIRDRRDKLETLVASRAGRFAEARASLDRWSVRAQATAGFADLHGHLDLWQGDFAGAAGWFATARDRAVADNDRLELARSLRHRALALTLGADLTAEAAVSSALEANSAVESAIGVAQLAATEALLLARAGHTARARGKLDESVHALEKLGASGDALTSRLLHVVAALIWGDAGEARRVASTIYGHDARGRAAIVRALAAALLDDRFRSRSTVVFDDPVLTRARWRAVAGT